jgi:hypothetical protein
VAAAVAQSFGVQAATLQPPPNIPLVIAFDLSAQPGVYDDGIGPYVHGLDEVQAYISGTCDIVSFRTKDANWTAPRKLLFDFTGYVIDNLVYRNRYYVLGYKAATESLLERPA